MEVGVERRIGDIGNYYGGLWVKEENGKFYWSIEGADGFFWHEVPRYLYEALTKFDGGTKDCGR